jgi:hypothetical protein
VGSSILPSGVSRSGDESEEWGRADGLTYEESDLPGTTHSGKKTFTSSRRQ